MARRRERTALDYFRFDVVAYLTSPDVTVMTAAQEGAFVRLLAFSARAKDCALDNDDAKLAVLSKLGDEWSTIGRLVRAQFVAHPENPSRLINEKLHGEWSEAWLAYQERCKRNKKNRLAKTKKVDDSSTTRQTTRRPLDARKGKGTRTGVLTDPLPVAPLGAAAAAVPEKSAVEGPTSTANGHGALTTSKPTSMQAEACQDWNERYGAGSAQGGRIAGVMTGLVRAQAKERGISDADAWSLHVRPAWRRYLAENTHPSPSAQNFVSLFRDWTSETGLARASPRVASGGAAARSEAAVAKFIRRGDQ